MSIELHCPKCSKLIRAPDGAGGKRGKCPYCGESVYIPMPDLDEGEIGLAPIDEEEERRAAELRREAVHYTAILGHETEEPEGADVPPPSAPSVPLPSGDAVDLGAEVKAFITAMRDSRLDEAEQAAAALRNAGKRAVNYVQELIVDDMPPKIESVPPPLAKGFLKTLLSRLR